MKTTKRNFSKDFKLHAVKLVQDKKLNVCSVAAELDINPQTLYRWIAEYEEFGDNAFVGKGNLRPEDKEIRKLKKRIADLELENLILKKAQAYFADPKNQN